MLFWVNFDNKIIIKSNLFFHKFKILMRWDLVLLKMNDLSRQLLSTIKTEWEETVLRV